MRAAKAVLSTRYRLGKGEAMAFVDALARWEPKSKLATLSLQNQERQRCGHARTFNGSKHGRTKNMEKKWQKWQRSGSREADAADKVLKSGVAPERVESGIHPDPWHSSGTLQVALL